jgi:hypothetical protein
MKTLTTISLTGLLTLSFLFAAAQSQPTTKALLFSKFPDEITCTAAQLNSFFSGVQGQNVKVSLNNNLMLSGIVKSNIVKYRNLQTVIVKLPAFNNILFTLSRRSDEHENITYTGHLFDSAFADGYELKKTDKANYKLIKISMEKILPACNQ